MRFTVMAGAGLVLAALVGCGPVGVERVQGTAAPADGSTWSDAAPDSTTSRPRSSRSAPVIVPDDPADSLELVPREQGGPIWAVVHAVSDKGPEDPKLDGGPGEDGPLDVDVDCDRGARNGLRLRSEKDYWYAAEYVSTQQAAFRYKQRYDLKLVGIVRVDPIKGCR